MKKVISMLLVIAMLACMIPAFSLVAAESTEEVETGLNADVYAPIGSPYSWADVYWWIIGCAWEGASASFEDAQKYDSSIDRLLNVSVADGTATGLTEISPYAAGAGGDGYMIKWTGTITAATSGTYYFVGHKLDNGFVAFVDGTKTYEYWACHHWFDSGNDWLYTNLGGFELEANVATPVEFWYLETNGGEALDVRISTVENGGSENAKTLADAGITMNLDATVYKTAISEDYGIIGNCMQNGVSPEGGNGSSAAEEANHQYDATIDDIMSKLTLIGSTVVSSFERTDLRGWTMKFGTRDNAYLVDYNGYITFSEDGTYTFGTNKVDNCFFLEIETSDGVWETAYEFWASKIWNDKSDTYYNSSLELEAGKSYPVHAVFVELDGGQALEMKVNVNGSVGTFDEQGVYLSTEPYTNPPAATRYNLTKAGTDWYYMTADHVTGSPEVDWLTDASVYTEWEVGTAPLADEWATDDTASVNKHLFAVKEFTIDNLEEVKDWSIMANMRFDDNIWVYINGIPVYRNTGWNDGYETYKLVETASDVLKEGTNTIAVTLEQGHGGYDFDASVYITSKDTSAYPVILISTAQQLVDYIAWVNNNNFEGTKGQTVILNADINMAGYAWTPMQKFWGVFNGNGHTIRNISYSTTVDATGKGDGVNIGLLVNELGNSNNIKGQVIDLTMSNCTINVTATEGPNKETANVGIIAGMVDRGRIDYCKVVNCEINGNAGIGGGVAGVACWAYDGSGVPVSDCTVRGTTITTTKLASGVVGYTRGGDNVHLGDVTVKNVTLNAEKVDNVCAEVGSPMTIDSADIVSTLSATDDYTFYYQTRTNETDSTLLDYRIICVAKDTAIDGLTSVSFNAVFTATDSETTPATKTAKVTTSTVYSQITSGDDVYSEKYVADTGTVIFGVVITDVPAGYTVSAEIVE